MRAFPRPYPVVPVKGGTPLQPWMSLARKNRHERDNKVHFDEPTHIYTVNGSSKGFVSATGFIHNFFGHFDADKVIANMMRGKNWPNSPWYGMTPAAIKAAWDKNRDEASSAGTAMHLGCEMLMNGAEDQVDPAIKATKEWEYFLKYWKKDSQIWEPWRTEWEVWDETYKLTGSIDMIYRSKVDGTFAIYDWKRAKEMKMENNYQKGLGPVSHLDDTNYWHYSLQLNLYKWFLETHYNVKVSELALVVLHPNNKSYKKYVLNMMDDEIQGMLAARLAAVKEGKGRVVVFEPEAHADEDEFVSPKKNTQGQAEAQALFLDE